jgi:hypothetical protein
MNKEELKNKFIVSVDVVKERLEPLVTRALDYCVVADNGTVHVTSKQLGPKDKIRLVLAARSLASQLSDDMSPEVSVRDLALSTGIPENQIRARANELLKERFATSERRGFYVANPHRIEPFLNSLPQQD